MLNSINSFRPAQLPANNGSDLDRIHTAQKHYIFFFCANGHETRPAFAVEAMIPQSWDCPRCGLPATQDRENPPVAPKTTPYKTHLDYVKERRKEAEAEAILAEALADLRERRANGEIIF